ncbi:MAG: hypothetical protein JJU11_18060 [Candidatus Sumerlaeia bacterium]|nr:hypothetical protein [Candidatus Sumerlaeia bacterium]
MRLRFNMPMAFAMIWLVIGGSVLEARTTGPRWLSSMDDAGAERSRSEKPTMIYFFNNVARPSYEMRVETLADPQVRNALGEFILVAINQQQQQNIADRFDLLKVPTTIFLDRDGREIDRLVGLKTVDEFLPYLERVRDFIGDGGTQRTAGDAFAESAVDIMTAADNTRRVTFTHSDPRARQVTIVGDFNDWRLETHPLQRNSRGEWSIDLHLREGVFEYLFHVDGQEYRPDTTNFFRTMNPYGGLNSIVIVGQPKMSPMIEGRTVTFIVYNAEARNIAVAGTFNNWNQLTMYRNPSDRNMWGVRYELPPGRYMYKYIVDGEWQVDPENYTPVDDGSGNFNSSFIIR